MRVAGDDIESDSESDREDDITHIVHIGSKTDNVLLTYKLPLGRKSFRVWVHGSRVYNPSSKDDIRIIGDHRRFN